MSDSKNNLPPPAVCADIAPCAGRRVLRATDGFTLLEVMVAVAIMSIVLLAVYRLHSQTLLMNHTERFYTLAPLLAQSKLTELQLRPAQDLFDDSGDFGEDYSGYTWDVRIGTAESELLGKEAENLKKIDLRVRYTDDDLSYSLRSYRFMPPVR
jgi:general secretion pathway protein I